jgi:hypothetical protein
MVFGFDSDVSSESTSDRHLLPTTRRTRMKRVALVQSLLILSLVSMLQRLQAANMDATTTTSATSASKQKPSRSCQLSLDEASTDANGSGLNDMDLDQSEKAVQEASSMLDPYPYYEDRYHFRQHEASENPPHSGGVNDDDTTNTSVLVVAAVDGTIAGVSLLTGKTIWRRSRNDERRQLNHLKTKQGQAETPLFEPLVSTTTTRSSSSAWRTSAVPSIDGKVHLTAPLLDTDSSSGLYAEKQSLEEEQADVTVTTTVSELFARVPFVDNRGRIYTGSRRSIAVAVDVHSGEVLQAVSTDSQCSNTFVKGRQVVWLGRVDQSISIRDPRSRDLDVMFSSGQILSVNDMVLGSGPRQPWRSSDRRYRKKEAVVNGSRRCFWRRPMVF